MMSKIRYKIGTLLVAIALSGCVAPDVVSSHKIEDGQLSCHDIALQMQQLEDIRAQARKGKTISGANVAAAVFFWPAVIGNYANANEAIEATNKREAVLVELAQKQKCRFKSS
ncbi:MAG: hypothetical protein AAFN80_07320 [Pseudomonadota bacterium]